MAGYFFLPGKASITDSARPRIGIWIGIPLTIYSSCCLSLSHYWQAEQAER